MKYIGIIPARYASTRFPAKPLALLGSKTVIERVYRQVEGVLDDVCVATDDERIMNAVESFGGKAVMTSVNHKSGTDRVYEAFTKMGNGFDVIVNIQGDEPFIQAQQLEAIRQCFDDETVDIATLVKPFKPEDGFEALENVNSPKVVVNKKMEALYFSRSIIPFTRGKEQSEWLAGHTYYKHIGLYAYRAQVLREITSLPQSSLDNSAGWRTATKSRWASAKSKPSASTHPKTWNVQKSSSPIIVHFNFRRRTVPPTHPQIHAHR